MTDILRISVPLTVWLASFSAVYGLEGLVCSKRWAQAGLDLQMGRLALVAAWALAIALQIAILLALRSPRLASPSAFVRGVSLTLAVVALIATTWTLFPVVATSLCLWCPTWGGHSTRCPGRYKLRGDHQSRGGW